MERVDLEKTEALSKAQREGYIASATGNKPTDNPYSYAADPDICVAWCSGFAAARTDRARINAKATTT